MHFLQPRLIDIISLAKSIDRRQKNLINVLLYQSKMDAMIIVPFVVSPYVIYVPLANLTICFFFI